MTPYIRMRLANRDRGSFRAEGDTIWLYDAIASDDGEAEFWGGVSPRAFIAALDAAAGPVTLRINSPGGSVFGAQAMVAAMRRHPHAITAQVDSLAASAASVILAECARVEIAAGAFVMIHKAWGLTVGNADDHLAAAELLDKIDGEIAAAYARRAGDKQPWRDLMAAETWFTAEEAVAAGLADAVLSGSTQRPAARWDLSAFARAPTAPAPETAAQVAESRAPDNLRRRLAVAMRCGPAPAY